MRRHIHCRRKHADTHARHKHGTQGQGPSQLYGGQQKHGDHRVRMQSTDGVITTDISVVIFGKMQRLEEVRAVHCSSQ